MFAFIRGKLAAIDANTAIIDVNGVGFKLGMSTTALSALGTTGNEVTVFTHLIVRDDALDLYGFSDQPEHDMFERLISVSGVGPKVALSALSSFNAASLQQLIIEEDIKRLTSIPGLGKKIAQRLVLELKGTLAGTGDTATPGIGVKSSSATAQVNEALLGMGFTKTEIELASKGYDGPTDDVGEQVRFVLQRLGGA